MNDISRRNAIGSIALGVAAAAAPNAANAATPTSGGSPMTSPVPAFAGSHAVKLLHFDPTKLDGLSEKLIRSHWENNYQGSVKTLNMI